MVKLLIIADDFTGALDTGAQFAKRGIRTQVFTTYDIKDMDLKPETDVLVVDTESRPVSKEEAYKRVHMISEWAVERKVPVIFKKTDSALRGNIGMELQAVVDTDPSYNLFFLPGYPQMERLTRNGIQYISGKLLEDSVFGKDPFEPVKCSYIPEIIREQSNISAVCITEKEKSNVAEDISAQIIICDVTSTEDIDCRLEELAKLGKLRMLAGCAGLAERLVEKLFPNCKEKNNYICTDSFYAACGSLNRITRKQVDYAEVQGGFCARHLTMEQKLDPSYYDRAEGKAFLRELIELCRKHKKVLTDTFDRGEDIQNFLDEYSITSEEVRFRISEIHGRIVREIIESGIDVTILMTGGDTLMGYMKMIQCTQLEPVCEIEPGVVVSLLEKNGKINQVISKSGGFGEEDILNRIAEKIIKKGDKKHEER